jgi:hypothetical protein
MTAAKRGKFKNKDGLVPKTIINHVFDWDEYLSKYPMTYRQKMKDTLIEIIGGVSDVRRETMSKKEKNVSEVEHDLKDTEQNLIKERNICTANWDQKGLNILLDYVANWCDEYMIGYCGSKNFSQISDELNYIIPSYKHPMYVTADGSMFDVQQSPETDRVVRKALLDIFEKATLPFPLTMDYIRTVFSMSNTLRCTIGRGAVKFNARGRASGDGWTTLMNTILQLHYWKYTLKIAGITKYKLFVKGDDVFLIIEKEDVGALKIATSKNFAKKNEDIDFGLAQILKELIISEDIEDVSFLSAKFMVRSNGNIFMLRDPKRVIQMLPWSIRIPNGMEEKKHVLLRKQLCWASGMSLLAWCNGLPIFTEIANKMIDLGVKCGRQELYAKGFLEEHTKYQTNFLEKNRDDSLYTDGFAWFNRRYGLSRSELIDIISQIYGVDWDGYVVSGLFDRF